MGLGTFWEDGYLRMLCNVYLIRIRMEILLVERMVSEELFAMTRLRMQMFSLHPLYHLYALLGIGTKKGKQIVSSTLACTADRVAEDKTIQN